MEAQDVEGATRALCGAIDQFHGVARGPHRDTHLAQEALRSCFAAAGNVHAVGARAPAIQPTETD